MPYGLDFLRPPLGEEREDDRRALLDLARRRGRICSPGSIHYGTRVVLAFYRRPSGELTSEDIRVRGSVWDEMLEAGELARDGDRGVVLGPKATS